jgi:hypothetical protein
LVRVLTRKVRTRHISLTAILGSAVTSRRNRLSISLKVKSLRAGRRPRTCLGGGGTQIIDGAVYLLSREVSFSGGSPWGTRCSQLTC